MSVYSEKVYEKEFTDKVSKVAYLDACKWLASHVFKNPKLSDFITVKIVKKENKKSFTFKVILYATIDEKEVKEDFCNKCKQLHTIFFCVDKQNCNECKMFGYKKHLESRVKNVKDFIQEVLEEYEEWEE